MDTGGQKVIRLVTVVQVLIDVLTYSSVIFSVGVSDNKMQWSTESAAAMSDGSQLTDTHPESSLGRDASTFSDGRTQDALTVMLPSVPSLSAHPYKGMTHGQR